MEITPILLFKFYVAVYSEQEKSRKQNCFQNGSQLEVFFSLLFLRDGIREGGGRGPFLWGS